MELTVEEGAALEAIRLEFLGARFRPVDFEMRPPTKAEYRAKRDKLVMLKNAWRALDRDTQWHLVCGLNAMWTDEIEDFLPDLGPVIDWVLDEMKKPSGAPEQILGLRRATSLLWSAWCARQLGGNVPISSASISEIAAEVSTLFSITVTEAERRVRHALRDMEKDGSLPRRGTTIRD